MVVKDGMSYMTSSKIQVKMRPQEPKSKIEKNYTFKYEYFHRNKQQPISPMSCLVVNVKASQF